MKTSLFYICLMAAICSGGCETEDPTERQSWAPLALVAVDPISGTTPAINVPMDNQRRALRVSVKPKGCLRVSSAVNVMGEELVASGAAAADSKWRTTQIHQTGALVLEGVASELTSVSFESVECGATDTGLLPGRVEIESWLSAVPSNPGLKLRLVVSESIKAALDLELLAQQIGLELELQIVVTQVELIKDTNLMMQNKTDFVPMADILTALPRKSEGIIDVVIGPCLQQKSSFGFQRLAGITPRIPGGSGSADAVFVARTNCDFSDDLPGSEPELARLTAHELGHYLGLAHPEELDGSEDDLPSTNSHNLMHRVPLTANATGLTTEQRERILAHPFVLDL